MDNKFQIYFLCILLLLTITEYREHKRMTQKLEEIKDEVSNLQSLFEMIYDDM